MGKNPGVTEMNEILTPTNITLNDAEDIANHFNCHFTQIGPTLAATLQSEAEVQRLVPESLIDWCKTCWNLKQDEQELKNLE